MAEQTHFSFYVNQVKFEEYLDRAIALMREIQRLQKDLNLLGEAYAPHMPMKGVTQALTIERKRRKLARKDEGAVSYSDQAHLEAKVRAYLDKQEQALAAGLEELERGESEMEP